MSVMNIIPIGAKTPRMFDLPKIQKQGVPLRFILSMTNSAQYQLAKWLDDVLIPVTNILKNNVWTC